MLIEAQYLTTSITRTMHSARLKSRQPHFHANNIGLTMHTHKISQKSQNKVTHLLKLVSANRKQGKTIPSYMPLDTFRWYQGQSNQSYRRNSKDLNNHDDSFAFYFNKNMGKCNFGKAAVGHSSEFNATSQLSVGLALGYSLLISNSCSKSQFYWVSCKSHLLVI